MVQLKGTWDVGSIWPGLDGTRDVGRIRPGHGDSAEDGDDLIEEYATRVKVLGA